MNIKFKSFIKNFSYTIISNLFSLLISTLMTLIVPKLFGVEQYGFWQLYLFYVGFVGFFHFGWVDGIYLKYGGFKYEDLDKKLFSSQFKIMVLFQTVLGVGFGVAVILFAPSEDKVVIMIGTIIAMILSNIRGFFLYILQSTNRIKEYSIATIVDKIVFALTLSVLLGCGVRKYTPMIGADIVGRMVSLFLVAYYFRDIVFQKTCSFANGIREAANSISVGVKLTIANIASSLIVGVVKFGIEGSWDVSTFGKVSLTLSISNFLMLFINAVGIVVYPVLRRSDTKKLPSIYAKLRNILVAFMLFILLLYFPIKPILSHWLPAYSESLKYMALLFPMCLFEGKTSLLVNTYFNTLREEKNLLKLNLFCLLGSAILTIINTVILHNLDLTVLSIVIILALKSTVSEIFITRKMGISVSKDILIEFVMVFIFISLGWFVAPGLGFILYLCFYTLYFIYKRKDFFETVKMLKQ